MSPRPPPKKHQVKKAQPLWKPGDPRQVIDEANARTNGPAISLSTTVPATATKVVPHSLGRLPASAYVTHGSTKVTVVAISPLDVTLSNTDAAPQTVTVAIS